jgi:hypothetical protein
VRSDIKLYFRGRCTREIFPLRQSDPETSFLQGHESGAAARRSARRGDFESERISQEIDKTPSQQIANTITRSTDRLQAGCYYINQLDSAVCNSVEGTSLQRQISNTITTRCDNDTQGVFPVNTTPDGVARTIKAQYYKTGFANLVRADGFGATGVICVADLDT